MSRGTQWREGVEDALNAIAGNFGGSGDSQEVHDLHAGVTAGRAAVVGSDVTLPSHQSAEFHQGWEFGQLVERTRQELLN